MLTTRSSEKEENKLSVLKIVGNRKGNVSENTEEIY